MNAPFMRNIEVISSLQSLEWHWSELSVARAKWALLPSFREQENLSHFLEELHQESTISCYGRVNYKY